MATENKIWLVESPINVCAGDIKTYSIVYSGATTVASPVMAMYSKTATVTSTLIPANFPTASGNVVSLSPISFPASPNKEYVLDVTAVVDGQTEHRKCMFLCQKSTDTQ